MLRRSKTLSIVMSLCLCLAMLAPVFVAPPAAQAAGVDYTALTSPMVDTDSVNYQKLGKVLIDIPDWRALPTNGAAYYEYLTISLPDGLEFDATSGLTIETPTRCVVVDDGRISDTTWQIKVQQPAGSPTDFDASIMVNFAKVLVKSGSGNLDATFSGANLFPTKKVTIAVKGGGATNTFIDTVKNIGDGGEIDAITIDEKMAGTLNASDVVELKLPAGFTWKTNNATIKGQWGFSGQDANLELGLDSEKRILQVKTKAAFVESTSNTLAGRIRIEKLAIAADDNAKYGDIEVSVSSDNDDVTEQDVIVAKYGTFDTKAVEGTKKDVVAGQNEQSIGEFYIEEDIAGSLVDGRTVTLELPDGCRWVPSDLPNDSAEKGAAHLDAFSIVSSTSQQKIKATVSDPTDTAAAKLKIKSGKIYVEPGFEGDVTIKVAGTAGVTGDVVVANCKQAVTLTAENTKDVVIGMTNQKAADIIITENAKGAIMDSNDHDTLVVDLPDGVTFTNEPKVEVVEGDFEIDDTDLINSSNALEITVKYASSKPSKIKISDVNLTLNRTVPEGAIVAELQKGEGEEDGNSADFTGSTALDEGYFEDAAKQTNGYETLSESVAGKVSIATTITPAQEGGNAMFKINSNIYQVNGISKVMDVAPYIKGNRTYVPVRYLAYAIGIAESDVVWDAATSKVTFTKGDKVVELTIGSTTITVNGEAQTMDVAPEIVNSRTMLPARFVAEAFGATVGWEAATGTVLVQQ